jgi:hypothetical protein
MPQVVTCPGCAKRFKVAEKFAGRTINCPLCKAAMTIPPAQLPTAPQAQPNRTRLTGV